MGDPDPEFGPDGRWHVGPEETVEEVKAAFLAECASSRRIAAAAGLQEYARHAGHLDVARELADATVGE